MSSVCRLYPINPPRDKRAFANAKIDRSPAHRRAGINVAVEGNKKLHGSIIVATSRARARARLLRRKNISGYAKTRRRPLKLKRACVSWINKWTLPDLVAAGTLYESVPRVHFDAENDPSRRRARADDDTKIADGSGTMTGDVRERSRRFSMEIRHTRGGEEKEEEEERERGARDE